MIVDLDNIHIIIHYPHHAFYMMLPFYAALPQGNLPQIRSSPVALHLDRAPSTWWKISESQLSWYIMVNHMKSDYIQMIKTY